MKNLLDHRYLLAEFFRHRLPGPLIFRIHLMPESRCMDIERHRQIPWFLLFQYPEHDRQETIDRIRMKPLRIRQIREPVKCPIQNTVSVY